jgi:hypothetical protein
LVDCFLPYRSRRFDSWCPLTHNTTKTNLLTPAPKLKRSLFYSKTRANRKREHKQTQEECIPPCPTVWSVAQASTRPPPRGPYVLCLNLRPLAILLSSLFPLHTFIITPLHQPYFPAIGRLNHFSLRFPVILPLYFVLLP